MFYLFSTAESIDLTSITAKDLPWQCFKDKNRGYFTKKKTKTISYESVEVWKNNTRARTAKSWTAKHCK